MDKKLVLTVLGIFILLSASNAGADRMVFTMTAGPYEIVETDDGFHRIEMVDHGDLQVPGKPMLPARQFHFALPPGAQVSEVKILGDERVYLEGVYRIAPAPGVIPLGLGDRSVRESREVWQRNYDATYLSDAPFPERVGEDLGVGGLRKYTYLRVAFYPFAYQPQCGVLTFCPQATVEVNYHLPPPGSALERRIQSSLKDRVGQDRARELLDNFTPAQFWYAPEGGEVATKSTYDYVIITTASLESAVANLVDWKEDIGHTVNLVTTGWISSNYSGWDLVEKIRNFLIDKYVDWGIEYVLLAGNIDLIPMRNCYPSSHSSYVPTDYYYADLTGNWDSDGDGYYGEWGQDSVDFAAEVYVGRIPWSDATTIANICDKFVAAESDTGGWKDNALLLGAFINFANEDHSGYPATDGAWVGELMTSDIFTGWGTTTMYEKSGLAPSSFSCDYPLTRTNVVDNWSSNDYGVVAWAAHGGTGDAWRKYWSGDDGDGVPESYEMTWTPFMQNSDASSLDDEHPSIVFCASCENGHPEVAHLARALVQNGAVGVVAATRVSYGIIGWTDKGDGGIESLSYYFHDYLVNRNQPLGAALYNSKYYCKTHMWQNWQNMFDFCLYGEPAFHREGLPATPQILATAPGPNVYVALPASDISASFDRPMDPASLNDTTVLVYGDLRGRYPGVVSYDSNTFTVTLDPNDDFLAGEGIQVTVSSQVRSAAGGTPVSGGHWWFFRAKTAEGSGFFGEDSTFGSGMDPSGVCSGDFDKDGHLDLAVINKSLNSLSIWSNDGKGSFSLDATYGVGAGPKGVVGGDLDGDAHMDLVVADSSDHKVSVLLNNGDGTFAPHQLYGTGLGPVDVFVADLNMDGHLDIATANSGSGNVSVLINDGDGSFATAANYGTASAPSSISAGNLDTDGHVDLVTANYGSNNISVLRNDHDGTFAAHVTYAVGLGPHAICVGDLNDDGMADLAVGNQNSDDVTILLNQGAGLFSVDDDYPVGDQPLFICVADLDDDGDGDLMVANQGGQTVSVLRNMGDGSFESATHYGVGSDPVALCASDLDQDGDLDLAAANAGSGDVSLLFNIDALKVLATSPHRNELDVPATSELSAHLNSTVDSTTVGDSSFVVYGSQTGLHGGQGALASGDSTVILEPDFPFSAGEVVTAILTTELKSSIGIPMNKGYQWAFSVASGGEGEFGEDSTFWADDSPQGVAAADLNGDGRIDLATANYLISSVGVLINRGDGAFQLDSLYGVDYGPVAVCVLDLERDGDLDLVSANGYSNTVTVLRNNGGIFSTYAQYLVGDSPYALCAADLDNDGYADLAVASSNDDDVSILLNQGDGDLALTAHYPVGHAPRGLCAGDVDSDGHMDLLVANYVDNTLSVLVNKGTGIFSPQQVYPLKGSPRSLGVGDFDGDGHLDAAMGDFDENRVSVVFNQGDGSFGPDTLYLVASGPSDVFVGDVDGDGHQDLALSRSTGDDVMVMRNDGQGHFSDQQAFAAGDRARGVCGGDVDGDGDLDLAVACYDADAVVLLYNASSARPPTAVSDLTAALAGDFLHLSWSAVTEDEGGNPIAVDHYTIYRQPDPNFIPGPEDSIGSTTETFYDDPSSGLKDPGINHYYVVKAVDSGGRKSADSRTVGEFDKILEVEVLGKGLSTLQR
jgi:hypothetical protein